MITEEELELALELRKTIKELKANIGKLEDVVISDTENLTTGVSVGGLKIEVDDYTKGLLLTFKEDITEAYRLKLKELKDKYKEIVESPSDTLRRILEENG